MANPGQSVTKIHRVLGTKPPEKFLGYEVLLIGARTGCSVRQRILCVHQYGAAGDKCTGCTDPTMGDVEKGPGDLPTVPGVRESFPFFGSLLDVPAESASLPKGH